MVDHERTLNSPEYPFKYEKIPVANGLEGFRDFIDHYPDFAFCPYVAEKDEEGWDKSTSRVYMNQVLPRFLYVPVNIPKDDTVALHNFFEFVSNREDIPAVNITQPHKSSPVLRELFLGDPNSEVNVDTLIRGYEDLLEPYDLNSTAFVEWYKDEVGPFQDKQVVLIGVGGVGEPIAKKIAVEHPRNLVLTDLEDKADFAHDLGLTAQTDVHFVESLSGIYEKELPHDLVVINAAGKEGAVDESELTKLIKKGTDGSVFVDIRPHLDIPIVKEAEKRGWRAYTGHGMNARNDFVLLQGIAAQLPGSTPPSFERFQQLVAQAS